MISSKGTSHPSKRESRPAVTERLPMMCQLGGDRIKDSDGSGEVQSPIQRFDDARDAALALLNTGMRLTRKAGSFLGQIAVDPTPLTPAQRDWLDTLLHRADLPPLVDGGRA